MGPHWTQGLSHLMSQPHQPMGQHWTQDLSYFMTQPHQPMGPHWTQDLSDLMTQPHQPADLHQDKDSPGYIVSHGRNKPCPPEAGSLHTRLVLAVNQTRDSHSYQYIHSSQPATAEGPVQPIKEDIARDYSSGDQRKVCADLSHRLFPTWNHFPKCTKY